MLMTIPFSNLDHCLLKENQLVDFDTLFLEKKIEEEVSISVAKSLGVPPQKIFHYLKKFVGEPIEKNEILAVNNGFFSNKKITSKYSGLIKDINHIDGSVTILSRTSVESKVKAFFKGKVNKITKNEILLEINKGEQFPAKNVDHDFGGRTFYPDEKTDFMSENIFDTIVVCENMTSYLKTKAEALGCQGFLTLNMLSDKSDTATGQFKNINDYKKAYKLKFSYCTIVSASSMIYFYQ